MKALVIENSSDTVQRVCLSLQLCWSDVNILSVAEGTQGRELAETESPDIVLLNLNLPGSDPVEVISEIRRSSDAFIIALSNGDDEVRRVKALEAGADRCIKKQVSPFELLAFVKALFRRAAMCEMQYSRLSSAISRSLTSGFTTRDMFLAGEGKKRAPLTA